MTDIVKVSVELVTNLRGRGYAQRCKSNKKDLKVKSQEKKDSRAGERGQAVTSGYQG